MNSRIVFLLGYPVLWIVLWGMAAAVSVGMRPPLPGTELQTMAVAWDMWRRDAFLAPGLAVDQAGSVYPLYLWLINGGWARAHFSRLALAASGRGACCRR